MLNIVTIYKIVQAIYIGAELVCKHAPKIMSALSMLVTLCSATAAIVPRADENGKPSEIHRYLDVIALNILNSAHDAGLATNIESSSPSEKMGASGQ
jgi:hypothetical protein